MTDKCVICGKKAVISYLGMKWCKKHYEEATGKLYPINKPKRG